MHLTKTELESKISELEDEIKKYTLPSELYGPSEDLEELVCRYETLKQEVVCWKQYYKQLLQELEQGE